MIPIKIGLTVIKKQLEAQIGFKTDKYKIVVITKDETVFFEVGEKKYYANEKITMSLFSGISIMMTRLKHEIDINTYYKDFEYTGVIVTFVTGENPYAELLMKHKKDGYNIKVKKLI